MTENGFVWRLDPPAEVGRARWPYAFSLLAGPDANYKKRGHTIEMARQWCQATFGPGKSSDQVDWRWSYTKFHIMLRYEQDAFAFKMRWG